ncbi:MAG: hypothetical protein HUJ30_05880, partial [Gammaproteobacteria bacterium]|nr:hypothetical protein [Gammaproteobacteria bacterium]
LNNTADKKEIDLAIDGIELSGWVHNIYDNQLIRYRPAKLKARDRLRLWLEHLALCAQYPDTPASAHFAKDKQLSIQPTESMGDAKEILSALISLYVEGHEAPLQFYPETSWEFQQYGSDKALKKWEKSKYRNKAGNMVEKDGEGDDPFIALALRGQDALDDRFTELAATIYGPANLLMEESGYE